MKIIPLVFLVGMLMLLGSSMGCTSSFGRTGSERLHMYGSITNSEMKMALDDVDHFTMSERRTRLSRWH